MSKNMTARLQLIALSALFAGLPMLAQHTDIPKVTGPVDGTFRFPAFAGKLGEKDPNAVGVIERYLSIAAPAGSDGLCGAGKIAIGPEALVTLNALLAIDGSGRSRLDMMAPAGVRSVRMSGLNGGIEQEDGSVVRFPASVSRAGLFPTSSALRKMLKSSEAALRDDGEITVGGVRYRAVTVAQPLVPGRPSNSLIPSVVTQLLFDSGTHLLLKAVDSVVLSESSRSRHLRVVSFADYGRRGEEIVPATISEARDGQATYRLTLTEVQGRCTKPEGYFVLQGGVK